MSRVRSKNTKPEMLVRRLVHSLGYRYRLHRKDLPGKPDLVFGPKRKAIFVHGCFWHSHGDPACKMARAPKSRLEYWGPKLARNRERDAEHLTRLAAQGWEVLVIWECQLKDVPALAARVVGFLGIDVPTASIRTRSHPPA
jgi:DNA mismatch endonuclease (patch repair protein)